MTDSAPSNGPEIVTRIDPPDRGGHAWRYMRFDGELVDVKCSSCGQRPLDLLKPDGTMRECSPLIGLMAGFLR